LIIAELFRQLNLTIKQTFWREEIETKEGMAWHAYSKWPRTTIFQKCRYVNASASKVCRSQTLKKWKTVKTNFFKLCQMRFLIMSWCEPFGYLNSFSL